VSLECRYLLSTSTYKVDFSGSTFYFLESNFLNHFYFLQSRILGKYLYFLESNKVVYFWQLVKKLCMLLGYVAVDSEVPTGIKL